MAHHHPHHHDHPHDHDHERAPSGAPEEPLDKANQSLADALRVSFNVLKGIMFVLVVVYLFSNVKFVESSDQALIVRMGALQPGVREAGLVWALPFPIDEVILLPTRRSNDLMIQSHTFSRQPEEVGKPLSFIARGHGGLNPSVDGALLTADTGLVHVQWKVTYKIDDVGRYITTFRGDNVASAEKLILSMVETEAIRLAGELTADELIRTRVDYVQGELRRRVNERLSWLPSGVNVTLLEMFEPTPPITVREAFDNTQKAENYKQKKIREAEQERTKILNEAAGTAYAALLKAIDELEDADTPEAKAECQATVDRILTLDAEGRAGRMIRDAGAYHSRVVNRIQSDVELYRTLLPEYERHPRLLLNRLWEATREKILRSQGVLKLYRPAGMKEFRIHIPLDPEQSRIDEELRLQKKDFDPKTLTPKHMVPVGVFQD